MNIYTKFVVILLLSHTLFASESVIDITEERIKSIPLNHTAGFLFVPTPDGSVVWEQQGNDGGLFSWTQEAGTHRIQPGKALDALSCRKQADGIDFSLQLMSGDDFGNIFMFVNYYLPNHIRPKNGRQHERRVGVWNKKFGFKLLNFANIVHVVKFQTSHGNLFVLGENAEGEEGFFVLHAVDDKWPWEVEPVQGAETDETPWDAQQFGRHGARLNILQQLLKKTKESAEKKVVMVMIEGEVAHLFDLLQYDVKRAQVCVTKANLGGKDDQKAKQVLAESKKHVKALLVYFNTLPKVSRDRIDAIRLPSNEWNP